MADRDHKKSTSRQQLIMTSINELALLLDEALQQMQQQMQNQQQGKGSCNKPGGSSPKPSAASMRKLQQQLNEQIAKMKEAMENGEKPGKKGKKPGQPGQGQGGMSKDLAKMAAEQEALRNELRKLQDELEKEGAGGGKGEMKKLADLMEQTETDLVNRNITRETMRRQQEILSKLLEHEKAEREREMDNERKSNEAKNQNFSNPAEFFEYKRMKQKEVELLKTVPPSLNSFYKGKVSEYFNNF